MIYLLQSNLRHAGDILASYHHCVTRQIGYYLAIWAYHQVYPVIIWMSADKKTQILFCSGKVANTHSKEFVLISI